MVIEVRVPDEINVERMDREDENDVVAQGDDELGYFGIVVKKRTIQSCQYNKEGQYVPRSKRALN